MTKLNQRQERFCQNIFKGMTATDAAIKARYAIRYAATNTDKLLKTTKIIERLAEMNTLVVSRIQSTKDKKLATLEKIYSHEPLPDQITPRDRIQAIAEHNKIAGDYAPDKHAVLGDIEITIVHRDKGK